MFSNKYLYGLTMALLLIYIYYIYISIKVNFDIEFERAEQILISHKICTNEGFHLVSYYNKGS